VEQLRAIVIGADEQVVQAALAGISSASEEEALTVLIGLSAGRAPGAW
jgi:hypothetical protein